MGILQEAIGVGEYPAKCFEEPNAKYQHRRFLRMLANGGTIRLLDSAGVLLDLESVMKGGAHFNHWYVTPHDAQVIVQNVEEETARVKKAHEQKRKEAKEQERQREQNEEAWREEVAKLKAAGLWTHPSYKTLKAAYADGWRERRDGEVGGEEISLKGHDLVRNAVRNAVRQRYVYKTTLSKVYGLTPSMIEELGEPDKTCDNPHWKTGPYFASLYLIERVEAWVEANRERVEKARTSRANRSSAMKAVHDQKRTERWLKAQEWVKTVPIKINRPLPSTLLADARKQYTIPDHVDLLKTKAIFAHVRHRQSNYEAILQELYQQHFSNDLYTLLRQRIDPLVQEAVLEWHAGRENHQ